MAMVDVSQLKQLLSFVIRNTLKGYAFTRNTLKGSIGILTLNHTVIVLPQLELLTNSLKGYVFTRNTLKRYLGMKYTLKGSVGSDSNEHLSNEPVHGFVTVIPVEYTRHRGFLQPPDQYSDFKSRDPEHDRFENINCMPCGKYTQIEEVTINFKPSSVYDSHSEWENVNTKNEQRTYYDLSYQNVKICVYMMNDVALRLDVEDGTNVSVQELVHYISLEEQLRLPRIAATVFTLWMSSGLLELQLKPHHKPLHIRTKWSNLLAKYAHASESRQRRDEPILSFRRNVYFSLAQEERIKDDRLLELLYTEAKHNILEGRYPCEISQYIMLGSIQARIELGPYNAQYHTLQYFRDQQARFLPAHIRNLSWNSWLKLNGKEAPEVKLLEHYRRLPEKKLQKKYLEFCWSLPYYGSAFFQGQIEQPVRGLKSLITHQDIPVLVGINGQGVYVINNAQSSLLVGLRYEELSWDFAKPSQEDNPDCLPCLFLQFRVVENGTKVSKILQIFSKQAIMMDALITGFVEELKLKISSTSANGVDRSATVFDTNLNSDGSTSKKDSQNFFINKLRKLTLATFDEEGTVSRAFEVFGLECLNEVPKDGSCTDYVTFYDNYTNDTFYNCSL